MITISSIVRSISGTPQFRITESYSGDAPTYYFYGQSEIEQDLTGVETQPGNQRRIRTLDSVSTAATGDVIFSLISGKASIVRANHDGYLLTQNYLRLIASDAIDAKYLVYLLNDNRDIRRQLQNGRQGSATLKYTIAQLGSLALPSLPVIKRQKLIGNLYFSQLRLAALRKEVAMLETILVLENIEEANQL